jgi:D-alanyl-D-alanine carboxypeptidase
MAAITAILASTLTVTGPPSPAQAATPRIATTWSSLMYRSLTAGPQAAQFRGALVTQQATFTTRVTELVRAKRANFTAQTQLTTATTADATAKTQRTTAAQELTTAKIALSKASRQKPRSNVAITRAKSAVVTATATLTTRTAQAETAATALTTAQADARTASTGLTDAITAWRTASVAIRQTQLKLAGVGNAATFATQATTISRDVVTQVRAAFTVADTTSVYGITVNKTVAYAFKRMIDDARADGVAMSGGGFRTTQRQIELRTINGCPNVWTAPSSSCRVPTAIPGRSLHELGLAVDISSGGRTISRTSPAYAWLTAHAGAYGFKNLPSEAWHWSITGS